MWAYPIASSFKKQIREMYNNFKNHKKRAASLSEHIKENYQEDDIYSKLAEELVPAWGRVPSEWAQAMSEIEII